METKNKNIHSFELDEQFKNQLQKDSEDLYSGKKTPNQIRKEHGFQPIKYGNVLLTLK